MALLPPQLRPAFVIRRRATRRGLFGPSIFWKIVAVFILGRGTLHKIFGRHVDHLGTMGVGVGTVLTVAASAPLSCKQAKRAGISKASLANAARADLEAARPAS